MHIALLGSGAPSAGSQVLAALIAAGALVLAAVIGRPSKKEKSAPQQSTNTPVTFNVHMPHVLAASTTSPDANRSIRGAVYVVVAGMLLGFVVLVNGTRGADGTDSHREDQPNGPSVPPSPAPAMAAQAEAQSFLASYFKAVANSRETDVLNQYWTFPADYYRAKDLKSAAELRSKMPTTPPSQRTCNFEVPTVHSLVDDGATLSLRTTVRWQHDSGREGTVFVDYKLVRAQQGQPFRIRGVSEPEQGPAC